MIASLALVHLRALLPSILRDDLLREMKRLVWIIVEWLGSCLDLHRPHFDRGYPFIDLICRVSGSDHGKDLLIHENRRFGCSKTRLTFGKGCRVLHPITACG